MKQRIQNEATGVGSRYYPDCSDARLEQEARALGFPTFAWVLSPDGKGRGVGGEDEALARHLNELLKGG